MKTWRAIDSAVKNNLYGKGVPGEGNRKAKVVLVGEAPGKSETLYGRPFIGREGRMLRRVLDEAGIDLKDVYITNAVKVRPPGNRTPTTDEINYWRPTLMAELNLPHPGALRGGRKFLSRLKKGLETASERLKSKKDSFY